MAVKFTNNAFSTLASSINSSATAISVAAGTGGRFPSLSSGNTFYATLVDSSNNLEIVKVTARSTDTLTVVRGQDNTSARSFSAGDRIELRPVAAALEALYQDAVNYSDANASVPLQAHIDDTVAAHAASAISFSATGTVSSTDVQAAIAEIDGDVTTLRATTVTGTGGLTGGGSLAANRTISIASGSNGYGSRTVSGSSPSGGSDGDIWYKV